MSIPSQPQPAASWNKLKNYQWNADGIFPKFIELCDLLINSDIDVLAVHLSKDAPQYEKIVTPSLEGRLLVFIRTDIVF